ncbi:Rpn family recombination-promoting nuclease/putative transposase [Treponema sp.]|uniref:Rpn family recombination-promoting nuclease/putative transposase n=1 Tax=Treponema sp. TaxID=166 RepID=UPI00298DA64B|nr:Rpn family recombination-promoting nuclease/putative transposase [Treponema sp.]
MKPWHELGITDDFIFCKVMQNESICRQMLELLLNIKIDRLDYVQNQYSISPDYNSHSIRLDVYVKDKDKVYDIEIQTTDKHNLEKRARYYQSLMDIDQLERSMDYRQLKESYVIFICTFDPFGIDSMIYTVKQVFAEYPTISYDDKTHKVFYNLSASELQREDSKLGTFLRYLETNRPNDGFTNLISKEVESIKHSTKWRKEYMTINDWIRDELEKGIAAGIEERWETEVEKRMEAEVKKEVEKRMEAEVAKEVEKRMEVEVKKEVEKRMGAEVAKEVAINEAKHEEDIYRIAKEMLENKIDVETVASITHLSKDKIMELK